jgi:hypothetical protein
MWRVESISAGVSNKLGLSLAQPQTTEGGKHSYAQ